jgi:hypothetical protein
VSAEEFPVNGSVAKPAVAEPGHEKFGIPRVGVDRAT